MFATRIPPSISLELRRRSPWLALLIAGVFACDEGAPTDAARESRGVVPRAAAVGTVAAAQAADTTVSTLGTIPLPINQSFSSTGVAFRINQTGTGPTSNFFIQNASNSAATIFGQSNGSGFAMRGFMTGTGRAAQFQTTNINNVAPTLEVINVGRGAAGAFTVNNIDAGVSALNVTTNSTFSNVEALRAVNDGEGPAAYLQSRADNLGVATLEVKQLGTGAGGVFSVQNVAGALNRGAIEVTSSSSASAGIFMKPISGGGNGSAVEAISNGDINPAGSFTVTNPQNVKGAIEVSTNGNGGSWAGKFTHTGTGGGVQITTNGGPGLQVVGGTKNAVVRAPGGARALYTEESTEVWFTDYGFSRLGNGRVRVRLDPTFSETISLGEPYHVFVQPYGRAEIYVTNRSRTGFDVSLKDGEPNVEFSYRVVAKRRGFESKRLERAPWADQPAAARRPATRSHTAGRVR